MAKWPELILPQFCNTEISVEIEPEEIGEDGAPRGGWTWSGKCNYQDCAKRVYTTEKEYVDIAGVCLIPGDIAPSSAVISSGYVTVNKAERKIVCGTKARNPDGTVNYTKLEIE